MKYLKMFENITRKYKKGDYVYLDAKQLSVQIYLFGKIISINSNKSNLIWNYKVNIFDSKENIFKNIFINESIISRKLTTEEIKEFEAKKLSLKFNI